MGYKKTGFVVQPISTYLLDYAKEIEDAFPDDLDKVVNDAIRSLAVGGGGGNIRLTNFWLERLLVLSHPRLDGTATLKQKFIILLAHYLRETGYIDREPIIVDYITDPTISIDEVVMRMLQARIPKFAASDIGGQFATIDTLASFFPEVIRRYAVVLREGPNLIKRLRLWLSNIGYKVITGQQIGQHERTAFVMYGNTHEGSPGNSKILPNVEKIAASETADLLVNEAGALYMAASLPGPYYNHQKLISDTLLQRLTAYFGPHITDLKYCVGYYKRYGPYLDLELTPSDSIAWGTDDHLTGLTSRTAYLMSNLAGLNPFTIRVPHIEKHVGKWGTEGLYEDDPTYRLTLTEQDDISKFEWDFESKWRGMRINSMVHSGTLGLALAEKALESPATGATQVEHATVEGMGIASYTDRAMEKIKLNPNNRIVERYLLPKTGGYTFKDIDMTAYYARIGNVEALPAFSEFIELPLKFFSTPVPRVVEYIASVQALPADERKRYEDVISLYHNCARYTRITKRPQLPINPETVARALLNII